MLKRLKVTDKEWEFSVIDIETNKDGLPILLGFYDGLEYTEFATVRELIRHIYGHSTKRVYAHYGMKFDFSLLFQHLLLSADISIHLLGSSGVTGEVKFFESDRKFQILDSYRLLPASLKKLTKLFNVTQKLELDCMPWELPKPILQEYLRHDCLGLYEVIDKFWNIITSEFGNIRANTLAALALNIYRSSYMKSDLFCSNGRLYAYENNSYFGGLCYCGLPGTYTVKVVDVNSMYPFIMREYKYPVSYVGRWVSKPSYRNVGLYTVDYSHNGVPFIYDQTSKELRTEGTAIVDIDTIRYLQEIGEVKVLHGYEYFNSDKIFSSFVEDIYAKRISSEEPLKYIYKILLNSLYGKFGQRRISRKLSTIMPDTRKVIGKCRLHTIELDNHIGYEVYDWEETQIVQHSFPVIASLVTLRSRLYLKKNMPENTVYCDTDSIHTTDLDYEFPIGEQLGEFKEEYTGKAIYLGKKLYQFEGHPPKCKGVPQSAVEDVDFTKLVESQTFQYITFPSIISQLRNDVSFEAVTTQRTIKKTGKPVL